MILLAGISSKLRALAATPDCSCPVCGESTSLHVIYKYLTPHIFFIPTFRFHPEYMVTCARCASVMRLDAKKGAAFRRDPAAVISREDFTVLQDNRAPRCVACGHAARPGERFCARCGREL